MSRLRCVRAPRLWVPRFVHFLQSYSVWGIHSTAAPIVIGSRVFIGTATDGTVCARNYNDGSPAWSRKVSMLGFCAAPLLMDGKVYVGNRDGRMYAFNAANGTDAWAAPYDTGAPICCTAAGADGKIVFIDEASRAWCLNAATGAKHWDTQLEGSGQRDYWPMIVADKVICRVRQAGHDARSAGLSKPRLRGRRGPGYSAGLRFSFSGVPMKLSAEQNHNTDGSAATPGEARRRAWRSPCPVEARIPQAHLALHYGALEAEAP